MSGCDTKVKKCRSQKGLTVVEVTVSMMVIAILATGMLPLVKYQIRKDKERELKRALETIRTAIDRFNKDYRDGLFEPIVFFTVVGLAYLVPRDVSFSLGAGPFVYFFVAGILAAYGVPMGGGGYGEPDLRSSLQAGAWVGAMGMIV